jgi:tetratricopeptide (TPR) repeat protein
MTTRTSIPRTQPRTPTVAGRGPLLSLAVFFFLLAIPLYGNTLRNLYALDDGLVLTGNSYVKSGIRGIPDIFIHDTFQGYFKERKDLISGGRYRPLSIATFALEHQVAGFSPAMSHAINLLLYGLTGALLYILLARLFRSEAKDPWWSAPPFLITLLFMTHPLHTEVVANIKGRDEILAFLFGIAAFLAFLSYFERPGGKGTLNLLGGGVFLLLGLMAKETVIPFVGIIPLGLWFFRRGHRRRLPVVFGSLILPVVVYFAARMVFAGPMKIVHTAELLNDPFAYASTEERVATIFKTLGIYLRLFFFPHPLTHDYYYNQIPLTRFGDPSSWIPAIIALGLAIFAMAGLRHRSPIAFGLLFFAITFSIVSNLFFSIGTTMAERFLYIPSLGLAISVVFGGRSLSEKLAGRMGPRMAACIFIAASVAFSATTVLRNPVWKDNLTLFSTDVKVSPNSAKLRSALAFTLADRAEEEKDSTVRRRLIDEAIMHLKRAVEIYPGSGEIWFDLGNMLSKLGQERAAEALRCYRQCISLEPAHALAYRNIALAANLLGDYREALSSIRHYRSLKPDDIQGGLLEAGYLENDGRADEAVGVYEKLVQTQPRNALAWEEAGRFYSRAHHDYARAIDYFRRAIALDPSKASIYENLGSVQILNGQHRDAIQTLEAGRARFGDTYLLEWNLGVAWQRLGDREKSERYLARARQLSPTVGAR